MGNEAENTLIARRRSKQHDTSGFRVDAYDIIIAYERVLGKSMENYSISKSKVNKNGKEIKTDYRQTPYLT